MKVNPYLNFDGTCREAFEFYKDVLGGEIVMITTYGDMPPPEEGSEMEENCGGMPIAGDVADRLAHVRLVFGDGAVLMGSDCPPGMASQERSTSVALQVTSAAEGERIFNALAEGGNVFMLYAQTFWAERFGMAVDRFGVPWMVNFENQS
ncbi:MULTISPECIES: VOC family protein [Kordiimonas]|jgi:PhnB protein|uniref:VOC family protein n=1 Tax=Kordiimonas TaxID=288021 RepID=UPI00257A10F7|nr:VOC family protein [Kordiimonas sp. UBA4487]